MSKVDITYRNIAWIDRKDPSIFAVKTVIRSENGLSNSRASAITGVAATTLSNWFDGKTRCPQNATITQVTAALGYVRRDELDKHGKVHVGFVRARDLDYDREIEKQADWLLKQGRRKKKRKPNGHANGRRKGVPGP